MNVHNGVSLTKNEVAIYEAKLSWRMLIFAVLQMPILVGFLILEQYFQNQLWFTNKRVIAKGKTGWFEDTTLDSPLDKINNISTEYSLSDLFFGGSMGSVIINTAARGFVFDYVEDPERFRLALMAQIEKFEEDKTKKQAYEIAMAMQMAKEIETSKPVKSKTIKG